MAQKKPKRYALVDFQDEMKAIDATAPALAAPLHVVLGEAVDVARFFAQHWRNIEEGDTVVRYGLESVRDRLAPQTGAEISALVELVQDAQSRYRLSVRGPRDVDPVARATFLIGELDAGLAFLFDDGVEDDKDEKLAAVRAAHADTGRSADALAAELADYVKLAVEHRPSLHGLGGFDDEAIDEAKGIVAQLREHAPGDVRESADALDQRNRLLVLLQRRVGLVRAAARFVFRRDPTIVRQVTSAYERRRRKKAAATPAPSPTG